MKWYIRCARSGEHRRVDKYAYMRKYLKSFDNTEAGKNAYIDKIDMLPLSKFAYWEYKIAGEVALTSNRYNIGDIKARNKAKPVLKLFPGGMTSHMITVRVMNVTAVKQFNESKSIKLLFNDQEYE